MTDMVVSDDRHGDDRHGGQTWWLVMTNMVSDARHGG